jgi:hypothetical protein
MPALLPVGIQSFVQLREGGFLYADKTELIHRLVTRGVAYFLSRPRRFGKSLLLTTIQALFEGRKDLFAGLWVEGRWDWSKTHPVVRVSLAGGNFREPGALTERLLQAVANEAERHGVELTTTLPGERLAQLLFRLDQRGPAPVVLIDEYDQPIVQLLESPGHEDQLETNRTELKGFYGCLKDAAPRLLLITGVSRVAKAGIFSGLNHLSDISWDGRYAELCGLTRRDLENTFAEPVAELAAKVGLSVPATLDRLRDDFNGFRFAVDGGSVYNPFSTLRTLETQRFGHYWTSTGTPEFLVRLVAKRGVTLAEMENVLLDEESLDSLDPLNPDLLPLMLQTGYLTITGSDGELMQLGFPNREVRTSFTAHLLAMSLNRGQSLFAPRAQTMGRALLAGDLDGFLKGMRWVFDGIPYQLDDAGEHRYHGLFHAMAILACQPPGVVLSEVPGADSRADLVIDLPQATWVFEFKRDGTPEEALQQIHANAYATPWQGRGKPVHLVGLTFDSDKRNLGTWVRG